MVNWIRKLSRRGGPCSPLPDRVIRCRWNWWARITHSTLMTADSCCSSNLQVTDAVNQFPSITLSPRLLMTTHVMNIVNTGVKRTVIRIINTRTCIFKLSTCRIDTTCTISFVFYHGTIKNKKLSYCREAARPSCCWILWLVAEGCSK